MVLERPVADLTGLTGFPSNLLRFAIEFCCRSVGTAFRFRSVLAFDSAFNVA